MRTSKFPPYVGVASIIAITAFIIANAVQLFGDSLRDWIVQMYNADPLRFIVASILIFAFMAAGAIWIAYQQYRGQQPENAVLSGFKEASTIRLLQLPENLSDDPKAREFILDFCKVQLDERQVRLDFGQTPPLFRSLDDPGDGFPQDLA